jgi:hypothetical protein
LGTGDLVAKPSPCELQSYSHEGREIALVACGKDFVHCVGRSTGVSELEEQRIKLERRVNVLVEE